VDRSDRRGLLARRLFGLPQTALKGGQVSTEQRVRAYARSARNSFYRQQAEYGLPPWLTNWRMLVARRFKIPIAEVRKILEKR
jgi:hypothetical protein